MRKLIFAFLLLAFARSGTSTPYHWECGTFTVDATDTLIYCPQISANYIYFTITNTTAADIYVRQIINSTNLPQGWSFNMCNPNACWGPNVLVDTFLVPGSGNVIARFDFHLDTAIGTGVTSVRFDDSANPTVNGATFNLYAISLTPITVSIAVNNTIICSGDSIILSAMASGGDGNYTYNWQPAGIGSGSGPFLYAPLITTTIMVIVTDTSGSPAGIDTVTIIVHPTPVAVFTGSQSGCIPFNACFYDLSLIPSGDSIVQWLWDFGDGSLPDTNQNPCHIYSIPSSPNMYSVTLTTTSNAGCTSSFTINNYITAYPSPVASFMATPQYVLMNQPVNFYSLNSDSITNVWLWDFGDGYYDTLQNTFHLYDLPGNYLVCLFVINAYGCTDTICDTVYVVTGIDELQTRRNSIFLSPNPATNELAIWSSGLGDKAELTIFNTIGEQVFSQPQTSNLKPQTIDVSHLPAGIYFLKVRGESGERTGKFLKE